MSISGWFSATLCFVSGEETLNGINFWVVWGNLVSILNSTLFREWLQIASKPDMQDKLKAFLHSANKPMLPTIAVALSSALTASVALVYPWAAPLGALAAIPLGVLFKQRFEQAHKIAIEEISEGRFAALNNRDPLDFASMAVRYNHAAIEGTAENNLRLLARLIEGVPGQPPITASEFLSYASAISSLSSEELIVFGAVIRAENEKPADTSPASDDSPWVTRNKVIEELVPQAIATKDDVAGAFAALSRTGFVVESAGWGSGEWSTTSAGRKVDELARFSTHPMANHRC